VDHSAAKRLAAPTLKAFDASAAMAMRLHPPTPPARCWAFGRH